MQYHISLVNIQRKSERKLNDCIQGQKYIYDMNKKEWEGYRVIPYIQVYICVYIYRTTQGSSSRDPT